MLNKGKINDKQIIKAALKSCGWSQKRLSDAMGYENKSSIATMLSRDAALRLDTFMRMLDAMGFEVVVRSKYPGMTNEEWLLSEDTAKIETQRYVSQNERDLIERLKYSGDV